MEDFKDRFDVFNLKSNNELDFDFLLFINGKYEEAKDHLGALEDRNVNLLLFLSTNTSRKYGLVPQCPK